MFSRSPQLDQVIAKLKDELRRHRKKLQEAEVRASTRVYEDKSIIGGFWVADHKTGMFSFPDFQIEDSLDALRSELLMEGILARLYRSHVRHHRGVHLSIGGHS